MARPEPNICSQKWGKGWAGARRSTAIVSGAEGFCDAGCCANEHSANAAIRESARNGCFIRYNLREITSGGRTVRMAQVLPQPQYFLASVCGFALRDLFWRLEEASLGRPCW